MRKIVNSRKGQKEPNLLIISSVLMLTLLTIHPVAASSSNQQSFSQEVGSTPAQLITEGFIEVGGSAVTLNSNNNSELLVETNLLSKDIPYMLGGTFAAILVILFSSHTVKRENEFAIKLRKILKLLKIGKITDTEITIHKDVAQDQAIPKKAVQEVAVQKETIPKDVIPRVKVVSKDIWIKDYRLYIAILILCIGIAEFLIFTGRLGYSEFLAETNLSKTIPYMLGGTFAAILVILFSSRTVKGENEFIVILRKALKSLKIVKIADIETTIHKYAAKNKAVPIKAVQEIAVQEGMVHQEAILDNAVQKEVVLKDGTIREEDVPKEIWFKDYRLHIAIPILCIGIAELLLFMGRLEAAVWFHIIIVFALSISNIFETNPKVQSINMPLVLLPILRLVNLSMPIFFNNTLLAFVLIYCTLAIPVAALIIHYRESLKDIGVTKKNLILYMILAIPLGFLFGYGEYMVIRPGYLIPDLTFVNLLKLTIIMVFLVGMIEELIFRSILQIRLEQVLGVREAIVITSIMFGLMHSGYGTFNEMLYTCFVGIFIGILFYKTKSLPFIAILHGFINVVLFGILPLLYV